MPAISKIADIVTLTLPTIEKNKWDQSIAQAYPDYECVKQFVTGARVSRDSSYLIQTELEIGSPSSFEASYPSHPLQTSAHKQALSIQTPLVKIRTSMTFSEDEKALQGASDAKILDIVQMRTVKEERDYWEGLEHSLLAQPTGPTMHPDVLRGIPHYVTEQASPGFTNGLNINGGDDPTGFTAGAGGITKAQETRWPNAFGIFAKVSQDDFFDKIDQFLNRVRMQTLVPNPGVISDVPSRVCYVQEPMKRALNRYFSGSNDNIGDNAGAYRGANYYNSIPFAIWHALSDPASPVRPASTKGHVILVDWNAFMFQVHSEFDRKISGPKELPNVPGQYTMARITWHALHAVRRDRCLRMTTTTPELLPSTS